jgi:hypothetical protein
MPGGDGTGPFGERGWPCGRIYGRGAAFRGGLGSGRGFGRGFGRGIGRGLGRDFGWRFQQGFPPIESIAPTQDDEKGYLEDELKELEAEKQAIEKRLNELENERGKKPPSG